MQSGLRGINAPVGVGNLRFRPKVKGSRTRVAQDKIFDGFLSPEDFGAKGNGVTDDSAAIQRAITYLEDNGGGYLLFKPKTYLVTTNPGIRVKKSGVHLVGVAGGYAFSGNNVGTQILYAGGSGGTVVQFGPDASLTPFVMSSCSMRGFSINGNSLAGTCLMVLTVYDSVFEGIDCDSFSQNGVYTGTTWSTGSVLNYRNTFRKITTNAAGSANGFFLDGAQGVGGGYNTSFASFYDCHSTVENGSGFFLRKCDDCVFFNIGVSLIPAGSGFSFRFFGSDTTDFYAAVGNLVFGMNSGAGIFVDVGTTFQARGNKVFINAVDHQMTVNDTAGLLFVEDMGSYDATLIPYTKLPIIQTLGIKRCTADFSKTSDTTLANITGLSVNVAAGKTYKFRAAIQTFISGGTAGGVKVAMGGTATVTAARVRQTILGLNGASTAYAQGTSGTTFTTAVAATPAAQLTLTEIEGTVTINAGGTITVQFAQNSSSATASTALAGSSLEVFQVD